MNLWLHNHMKVRVIFTLFCEAVEVCDTLLSLWPSMQVKFIIYSGDVKYEEDQQQAAHAGCFTFIITLSVDLYVT